MANILNIWLIASTSTADNSGSSDSLELEVDVTGTTSTGTNDVKLDTGSSTRAAKWGSKNDAGNAAVWEWVAGEQWTEGDITTDNVSSIFLAIEGDDMWLPQNIFVVFQDSDGNYTLPAANGNWPSSNCFSEDTSDCGGTAHESYQIS